MAIKITTFDTLPALAYDNVHVSELRISLSEETVSKTAVSITYKLYALDDGGQKYFQKAQHVIRMEDYEAAALAMAQAGDMGLVTAMQAIEAAVAKILANDGKHGTAAVA